MDSFTFHTFYLLTSSLQKSICSSLVHIQTLCCIKKNFLRLGSFDALCTVFWSHPVPFKDLVLICASQIFRLSATLGMTRKHTMVWSSIWPIIDVFTNFSCMFLSFEEVKKPHFFLIEPMSGNTLKFRYSWKATKIAPSSTYDFTLQSNSLKKWKMGQIFVAFSEYLNFNQLICNIFNFKP